jgi:hypothetical protein
MRKPGLDAAAALAAVVLVASCSHGEHPAATASRTSTPPVATSSASAPAGSAAAVQFSCERPIDQVVSPVSPLHAILHAVALETSATLQANDAGGTAPHRLFAKTPLLVHVGTPTVITVVARWASRASITWGNRGSEWTSQLQIPACPSNGPGGDWLGYPGGLSVDQPSCVPLEIRSGGSVTMVRMSVGARC